MNFRIILFLMVSTIGLGLLISDVTYAEGEQHYVKIPDVPLLSQYPELPTGCESTAAAMLLQWAGIDISKEEIANALPKGDMPSEHDGNYIGVNPEDAFVGDPYTSNAYGVFHKPISNIINKYIPGKAKDISGSTFNDLLHTIQIGKPVEVWATIDMITPSESTKWLDSNGNEIDWNVPEHALLMTGFDDNNAYMNDPYTGQEATYDLWAFKSIWETMGSQAVTVADDVYGVDKLK